MPQKRASQRANFDDLFGQLQRQKMVQGAGFAALFERSPDDSNRIWHESAPG